MEKGGLTAGYNGKYQPLHLSDLRSRMLKNATSFCEVVRRLSEIQWNLWMGETNGELLFPPHHAGLKALRGKQQRKENLRGIPVSCLCA